MAKRKLDVVIADEYKAGPAFKKLKDDAKDAADDVEKSGEKAGEGFGEKLTGNLKGLGGKMSDLGGKVAAAFGTALMAGGAAAAGLLAAGFTNMLETELAADKLVAQLGGSEWAQEMGEIAGDLYVEGFGDSVTDVANTLKEVKQAGLLTEDATNEAFKNMTGQVMTFSDVLDQDMSMSVQAVSNMLRTGLAKDGVEALDLLTRGIQQGADRAGDLAETFQEYSTMFRDVGLSGAESMGLLVQGLDAGARDADTVADAIKEFAIRAQDASETSAEGFEAIGLNAEEMTAKVAAGGPEAREALDQVLEGLRNMEDPAARNLAAVALFGTKAEDLGDALFNLDLDTAAQRLGTVAGATEGLGGAYDNAASKIETFKRQALDKISDWIANTGIPALQDFAKAFKEDWLPALQEVGTWVKDHLLPPLQDLGKWFAENPEAIKILAAVIAGVLVIAFLAWTVAAGAAAVATFAATWEILAIIAVIALLVAGVIYAYQNWDWFRDAVNKAAFVLREQVWPALQKVWEILAHKVAPVVADFIRHWWDLQQTVYGAAYAINSAVASIAERIASAWRFGAEVTAAVWNWIADKVGGVLSWIADRISWVSGKISGLKSALGSATGAISPLAGLLGFQTGGIVPGTGAVPAMVHGGEMVLNAHQQATMFQALNSGVGLGTPVVTHGGDTYIQQDFHIQGSVLAERDLIRTANRAQAAGYSLRDRGRSI